MPTITGAFGLHLWILRSRFAQDLYPRTKSTRKGHIPRADKLLQICIKYHATIQTCGGWCRSFIILGVGLEMMLVPF